MAYIVKRIISIGNMYVGYQAPAVPAVPENAIKTQVLGEFLVTQADGDYIVWR